MSPVLYVLVAVVRMIVLLPFAIVADAYAFVLRHKVVVMSMVVAVLLVGCGGSSGYCPDSSYTYSDPGNPSYPYGMCKKDGSVIAATSADQWISNGHTDTVVPGEQDTVTKGFNSAAQNAQQAGNPVDNTNNGLTSMSKIQIDCSNMSAADKAGIGAGYTCGQ